MHPAKAANFGRYSSHWHVMSPHRTVDVADIAWASVTKWANDSAKCGRCRSVAVHVSYSLNSLKRVI